MLAARRIQGQTQKTTACAVAMPHRSSSLLHRPFRRERVFSVFFFTEEIPGDSSHADQGNNLSNAPSQSILIGIRCFRAGGGRREAEGNDSLVNDLRCVDPLHIFVADVLAVLVDFMQPVVS